MKTAPLSSRHQRFSPLFLMTWPIIILVSLAAFYGLFSFVSSQLTTTTNCSTPAPTSMSRGASSAATCSSVLLGKDGMIWQFVNIATLVIGSVTVILGAFSFMIGYRRHHARGKYKPDQKSPDSSRPL